MKKFTLLELLIVIAVIAILLSMLLPSLEKSRELAKRAVCLSNHSQFGKGFQLYAKQEDNKLPPNLQVLKPNRSDGTESIWSNDGENHPDFGYWLGHGRLYKAEIVTADIFDCPSNKGFGAWSTKVGYEYSNGLMGGIPVDSSPQAKGWENVGSNYIYRATIGAASGKYRAASLFKDQGNTPILADWFTDPRPERERSVEFHHGVGYNILSLDSSARFIHEPKSQPILYKNGTSTYHWLKPNFIKQEEVWEQYFIR